MSSVVVTDQKRQRIVLFSIAFASFMVNVDTYIVNISLPTLARYFQATAADVSWVILSYQLAVTSLLLIFGRLGDRVGLKKIFILGFALFTVTSLLCGLSPCLWVLVCARFLQGIGASVLYALTPAMIPRFLPEKVRGPAFGALATATALGITVGTPLGGLITGFLSWHWIFLVNVPIGLIAILVCRKYIPAEPPESLKKEESGFDLLGALLSFIGTFAIIYALSMGKKAGWASPLIMSCFLIAAASIIGFILWEKKARYPLFDMSLFRDAAFTFGNSASFMAYVYLAGNNFLMPFYLMRVLELSPEKAGFVFMLYSLVYMAVGPLSGWLSVRVNPRMICTFGMILCSFSAFGYSHALTLQGSSFSKPLEAMLSFLWIWIEVPIVQVKIPVFILAYFVLLAISMASFCTSNNNVVMGMAPEGKQGIVSGMFRMIMRMGMSFGVCLFQLAYSIGSASAMHFQQQAPAYSKAQLIAGFHEAYIVGGIACIMAVLASLLARKKAPADCHLT
jgi:EmrB/QacA subfamily drug resistance transporter